VLVDPTISTSYRLQQNPRRLRTVFGGECKFQHSVRNSNMWVPCNVFYNIAVSNQLVLRIQSIWFWKSSIDIPYTNSLRLRKKNRFIKYLLKKTIKKSKLKAYLIVRCASKMAVLQQTPGQTISFLRMSFQPEQRLTGVSWLDCWGRFSVINKSI